MPDTAIDHVPAPVVTTPIAPVVAVPVATPSTAQIVSSSVQNIAAIVALSYAGYVTKALDPMLASVAICLISGIDLMGRRRLVGLNAAAMGATGLLTACKGLGSIAFGAVVAAGLTACAGAVDLGPIGHSLGAVNELYRAGCTENARVVSLDVCEKAGTGLNLLVDFYSAANEKARADESARALGR